jgi:hypothetical protein
LVLWSLSLSLLLLMMMMMMQYDGCKYRDIWNNDVKMTKMLSIDLIVCKLVIITKNSSTHLCFLWLSNMMDTGPITLSYHSINFVNLCYVGLYLIIQITR